ncbi:MAG: 3TM-type holin [Thermodesulfobacteriota bacterium]|nr:3TM-type holin [Thermodesulfobacteriota bacterium]
MGKGILNLDFGGIIGGVGKIVDDLHTSKEEELSAARADKELDVKIAMGQMAVNQVEAQHKSVFVAGWRPFIGWVGGSALAWKFIGHPLACWMIIVAQGFGYLGGIESPPSVNASELYPIVLGMLGIGGMRSYDKLKGTATQAIRKK